MKDCHEYLSLLHKTGMEAASKSNLQEGHSHIAHTGKVSGAYAVTSYSLVTSTPILYATSRVTLY